MTTDWLRYSNQNATRSLPLDPRLVKAFGFLPEMGLQMDVFSGGQPSEGPNRTGSHRHDNGGAADVFFSRDGHRLDWSNPQDLPIFEQIVSRAKANGVTGFGAGEGYMRPGSMHVGFGAPAVWGAGGSGANAPEWLRRAFGSAPQAPGTPAPTMTEPKMVAEHPVAPMQSDFPPAPTAPATQEGGFGQMMASMLPRAAAAMAPTAQPQADFGQGDPMGATNAAFQGAQAARGLLDRLGPDIERLLAMGKRPVSAIG